MLLLVAQQGVAGDPLGDMLNQSVNRATKGRVTNADQVVRSLSESASASRSSANGVASKDKHATLEHKESFYTDYIADYWKQPGASGRGDDPSSDAPGHVIDQPRFSGNQKQDGVPEMRDKLEKILAQVLAHPAVRDIRGASLSPGGGFYREKGGPMGTSVPAHLSLMAYTIFLDSPKTRRFADGTYHTSGHEGDSLNIGINDPDVLEGRIPIGTYNGLTVVSRKSGYELIVPNTDRPIFITKGGEQVLNPNLIDPSRPRSDIQFLTVYVGAASNTWSDIARGKQKPTSGVGRLLGVMFNSDWAALLQQIN